MSTRGPWRRRWQELTPRQRTLVLVLGSAQLSLAATAWADLATRPVDEVNGSKVRWAAVIAINWIGPLAWFRWGRLSGPTHGGRL
ncbi:PLDc N-terminal domain-containing protein [Blastococcus sp. VKM Ac-2987]|uniref:PLDc N-terminal domain-containing protein n=1 Tax=Blastococcus sp. VKM Ac-2987 TaxID=3004141 RepID=UPI0022AB5239|nr:PLDc N-terminal domain-containing protein [Blastococcus sp. VKM Ac-2987]MCZ2860626.1 PLDc N-terminal domain-containing protein [Blastococcus sp. VKM Ac-2987]